MSIEQLNGSINEQTKPGIDIPEPEVTTPEPTQPTPEPETPENKDEPKKITEEDIKSLKHQFEETQAKELAEIRKAYEEQTRKLQEELEQIKLANMKEEERRLYELKKKEEAELEERNRIIEENKRLKAEREAALNQAYIKEQFSKYSFIPEKYHKIFENKTRDDWNTYFTPEVLDDLRELDQLRKQEKKYGTNVFPGGQNAPVDTTKLAFEQVKERMKKELGLK